MTTELNAIYKEPPQKATGAVIWLHGLGASGHDFADVIQHLKLTTALRFIFPHAPEIPITINQGMVMPGWYDIYALDDRSHEDKKGILNSAQAIYALIETIHKQGIAYNRIALIGFSQGGAMALHCGLHFSHRLATIIGLSCYLPLAKDFLTSSQQANQQTPILMAHGQHDDIVPYQYGQMSYQYLKKQQLNIQWQEYSIAHTVNIEELRAIGTWLNHYFAKKV